MESNQLPAPPGNLGPVVFALGRIPDPEQRLDLASGYYYKWYLDKYLVEARLFESFLAACRKAAQNTVPGR